MLDWTDGSTSAGVCGESSRGFKGHETFSLDVGMQMPIGRAAHLATGGWHFWRRPKTVVGVTVPIGRILGVFSDFTD